MKFLILSILSYFLALNPVKNHPIHKEKSNSGFAVVELYTSEGCSSCPSADELFEKVQKEIKNEPIYLLAFHVDYWNRLGWKDPFSSPEYSARQNQYASWLNLSTIYTPQAIVNGRTEFIGSDERSLRNALKSSIQKNTNYTLHFNELKYNSNSLSLKYHTESPLENISLVLALVQNHATTQVKRGENEGRTLSHVQIVRNYKTLSLSGKEIGTVNLDLVKGIPSQNFEVIGFLQKNSTGEILAATRIPLNSETL